MKPAWILAPALLALAACGGEAEKTAEGRNMSVEEVASELASVKLDPGMWETTARVVEVSAPNLPVEVRNMMQAQGGATMRNCITPEQAERPDANFLAAQQDSNCSYQDFSMRNGRLAGTMTCTGGGMPGQMRAEMEGEYGSERYDMRMTMTTAAPMGGGDMTIVTETSGRLVGPCQGAAQ